MERYDIAVLGTGPAGLEAAVTAKVRGKRVLLLGSPALSDKVRKAAVIQNYLGLPDVSGAALQAAFLAHLRKAGVSVTEDHITAVYAMGAYFALQGRAAEYEASSVILACGVSAVRPLPGEQALLGRGVSYCATCDAALYKGRTAIVAAYGPDGEPEAEFLAERAARVLYLPQYDTAFAPKAENLTVERGAKPVSVTRADGAVRLALAGGTVREADGVFLLRPSVAPAQLVPGLATDGAHVAVDRAMRTNLDGLFACGDVTGTPYQYSKAAGEGNVAALSAVKYLETETNKTGINAGR